MWNKLVKVSGPKPNSPDALHWIKEVYEPDKHFKKEGRKEGKSMVGRIAGPQCPCPLILEPVSMLSCMLKGTLQMQ